MTDLDWRIVRFIYKRGQKPPRLPRIAKEVKVPKHNVASRLRILRHQGVVMQGKRSTPGGLTSSPTWSLTEKGKFTVRTEVEQP